MANKECQETSPLMQRLRDELDRRGVPWADFSTHLRQEHLTHHAEKTRFKDPCGIYASVTWGWQINCGVLRGMSAGYPDKLECWYRPDKPSPRVLSVEEVIELCLEGGHDHGRA